MTHNIYIVGDNERQGWEHGVIVDTADCIGRHLMNHPFSHIDGHEDDRIPERLDQRNDYLKVLTCDDVQIISKVKFIVDYEVVVNPSKQLLKTVDHKALRKGKEFSCWSAGFKEYYVLYENDAFSNICKNCEFLIIFSFDSHIAKITEDILHLAKFIGNKLQLNESQKVLKERESDRIRSSLKFSRRKHNHSKQKLLNNHNFALFSADKPMSVFSELDYISLKNDPRSEIMSVVERIKDVSINFIIQDMIDDILRI